MRFNTDQALFDAFPTARAHVGTEPSGVAPGAFLARLYAAGKLHEALSFCAYLLPRREAVAWACQCLRARRRDAGADAVPSPALEAAEAWVASPSEERRRAAYERWQTTDHADPAAWIALGSAWSGGSVIPDRPYAMPAAPHMTPDVIRVALILLLHAADAGQKLACVRDWLQAGERLAEAGL